MINSQNNLQAIRPRGIVLNPNSISIGTDEVKKPTKNLFTRPVESTQASDRFSNEIADDRLRAEFQGRQVNDVFTSQPLSRLPSQVQAFDRTTSGNLVTSVRQAERAAAGVVRDTSSRLENSVTLNSAEKIEQPIITEEKPSRLERLNEALQKQAQDKVEQQRVGNTDKSELRRTETNQEVIQNFLQNEAKRLERAQIESNTAQDNTAQNSVVQANASTSAVDSVNQATGQVIKSDTETRTSAGNVEQTIDTQRRRIRQTGVASRQRPEVNQNDLRPENANRELNDEQSFQRIQSDTERTSVRNFQADQLNTENLQKIGPQRDVSNTSLRDASSIRLTLKRDRLDPEVIQQTQAKLNENVEVPKKAEQQEQKVESERSELREQIDAFAGAQAVPSLAEPRLPQGEQEADAVFSRLNVSTTDQRRPISAPADARGIENSESNRESRENENRA
jgi:hypothetical protein